MHKEVPSQQNHIPRNKKHGSSPHVRYSGVSLAPALVAVRGHSGGYVLGRRRAAEPRSFPSRRFCHIGTTCHGIPWERPSERKSRRAHFSELRRCCPGRLRDPQARRCDPCPGDDLGASRYSARSRAARRSRSCTPKSSITSSGARMTVQSFSRASAQPRTAARGERPQSWLLTSRTPVHVEKGETIYAPVPVSIWAIPVVIAIPFHEAAHGFVARSIILLAGAGFASQAMVRAPTRSCRRSPQFSSAPKSA
jgi:hypothetical protein